MGKEILELAYLFFMIFNQDYVTHINNNNDSSSLSSVFLQIKCGQIDIGSNHIPLQPWWNTQTKFEEIAWLSLQT